MHNIWTRANALFFTSMVALGSMCALTTFTTFWHVENPKLDYLKIDNLERFSSYADNTDKAVVYHTSNGPNVSDLSSVFNWNTKQLFVYVVAEYTSSTNKLNQVVIWDKIIPTIKQARLKVKEGRVKYFLADQFKELRNVEVRLKLMWDIMPVCGRLFIHSIEGSSYQMPTVYLRNTEKTKKRN